VTRGVVCKLAAAVWLAAPAAAAAQEAADAGGR